MDIHFNDVDDFGLPAIPPTTGILPATKDDGNTPAKQSLGMATGLAQDKKNREKKSVFFYFSSAIGLCLEYQQIPC